MENKRFKTAKWIMLSFAILLNGFIIVYSCLSDKTTNAWSRFVSNIFTSLINNATKKDVKIIPASDIEVDFSDYTYNDILGYETNEIPLGNEKEISALILPDNATNKAVSFYTDNTDIVSLNQNDNKVSIVGLKEGTAIIKAYNSSKEIEKEVTIKVLGTKSPSSFDASLTNTTFAIGEPQTLDIIVDNEALGNDELLLSRYYDTTKLIYSSSNESVAEIDKFGVIYPISTGTSTIKVSNDAGIEKSFNITVTDGTPTPNYTDLSIEGSDICYENDIIKDQSSHNNHFALTIKNGEETLDPKDFIWESSNNLLAKVDKQGVLRGFRKTSYEDEEVIIKATSKKTKQEITKKVLVKKQLPEQIYTCFMMGEKEVWYPEKITAFVGDVITVKVMYDVYVNNYDVNVEISNNEIMSYTNQGNSIILEFNKEGTVDLTITSNIVSSLKRKTTITVVKAGAIGKDDIEDFNLSVRKSIGHATLFGITQIFTFLAIYMVLYDKKIWILALISLGAGTLLASISELIQFFIPLRSGTFIDVLIDMAGVTIGLAIIFTITLLIKTKKNKE